jgi:heme-degrading monooxygenase HmoA
MHIIMWEFVVHPDKISEFVSAYKPDGQWAQLFRLAAGYEGTELLSSTSDAKRFVTIDRWSNADDYALFQERFNEQYRSLDAQLEALTTRETKLGLFTTEKF